MNIDAEIELLKKNQLVSSVELSEGWGFASDRSIIITLETGLIVQTDVNERVQRLSIQTANQLFVQEKHWPLEASITAALSYAMEFGLKKTPNLAHSYELHYYESELGAKPVESSKAVFKQVFDQLPVSLQEILKAREQETAPGYARSANPVCVD